MKKEEVKEEVKKKKKKTNRRKKKKMNKRKKAFPNSLCRMESKASYNKEVSSKRPCVVVGKHTVILSE